MDIAPEIVTTVAAFLSGMGSVLTGFLALRWERKRSAEECANRIAALHEGIQMRAELEASRNA